MRNRSRALPAFLALTASPLLLAASAAPAPGTVPAPASNTVEAPGTVEVDVSVTDVRSDKGVVLACLTADPRGFPKCRNDSRSYRLTVPAAPDVTLRFTGVKPGTYAIALLHDENDNGRADRTLLLIPKEGFGFSRNAPVRLGPPSFASAAFHVGHANVTEQIKMRYML